jgi:hypothetical protein
MGRLSSTAARGDEMRRFLLIVVLALACLVAPQASAPAQAQACQWYPSNACPAPGSAYPDYPCFPGQIKANLNSRIYHMPGQRYYGITGSGATSNVWCVDPANEWEVQSWGYRRSLV